MFIGPCIITIFDEWKTNMMSLAILFHLLCAQHVSDVNISIFRSLRLCWWITTSVVLFCKDGCFSISVTLRCEVVCLVWCVLSPCCSWYVYFNLFWPLSIMLCEHCVRLCVVFFIGCLVFSALLMYFAMWIWDCTYLSSLRVGVFVAAGNSSTQSQAPEDGYINVRNMLSA